jgi:hypothetical protein
MWGEQETEVVAWPWTDLAIDDFVGEEGARYATLSPEQVAQVAAVPNGGQVLIPIEAPDGEVLNLSIRPQLPDEVVALER